MMEIDKNVLTVSSVGVVAIIGLVILMLNQGGDNSMTGQYYRGQWDQAVAEGIVKYGSQEDAIAVADIMFPGGLSQGERHGVERMRRDAEVVVFGMSFDYNLGEKPLTLEEERAEYQREELVGDLINSRENDRIRRDVDRLIEGFKGRYGGNTEEWRDYATAIVLGAQGVDVRYLLSEGLQQKIAGTGIQETSTGTKGTSGYNFPTGRFTDMFRQCMVKPQFETEFPDVNKREVFCRCKTSTTKDPCRELLDRATSGQVSDFKTCFSVYEGEPTATVATNLKHAWHDCKYYIYN